MAAPRNNTAYLRMMNDLEKRKKENGQKKAQSGAPYASDKKISENAEKAAKRYNDRQAENAQRAQRVVANYNMQKSTPAAWRNNSAAQRMQNDLKTNQKSAANTTTGFKDWSMVDNLLRPGSKVNQLIGQQPAEEQKYWQGVRDQLNPQVQKATVQAEQAMGAKTPYTRAATGQITSPLDNYKDYARDMGMVRKYGMYKGQDVRMMSDRQLEQFLAQNQEGYDKAKEKAGNWDEENQKMLDYEKEEGKYRTVAENGLPMMLDNKGNAYPMGAEENDK